MNAKGKRYTKIQMGESHQEEQLEKKPFNTPGLLGPKRPEKGHRVPSKALWVPERLLQNPAVTPTGPILLVP